MKGQKVQLRITEVNRARRRVVGSIRSVTDEARKAAQEAVWSTIEVGKHYTGTVKSMTSYGVFVDIGGVDGMVHISELSWSRIKHPSEVVKVGDTVEAEQSLFTVESDKASMEIPSPAAGTITALSLKLGDKVNVGDVVGAMTVQGAAASAPVAATPSPASAGEGRGEGATASVPAPAPAVANSQPSPQPSPASGRGSTYQIHSYQRLLYLR